MAQAGDASASRPEVLAVIRAAEGAAGVLPTGQHAISIPASLRGRESSGNGRQGAVELGVACTPGGGMRPRASQRAGGVVSALISWSIWRSICSSATS